MSWLWFYLILLDRNQDDGLDVFIFLQIRLQFLRLILSLFELNITEHEFRQLFRFLFNPLIRKGGWLRHTYTLSGLFLDDNCRYWRFELAHSVLVLLEFESIPDSSAVAVRLQKSALMCLVSGKLPRSSTISHLSRGPSQMLWMAFLKIFFSALVLIFAWVAAERFLIKTS